MTEPIRRYTDEELEDDDEWEYDHEEDSLDEAISNCYYHPPSGFCLIAGTEYCDWDCPFNEWAWGDEEE